MHWFVYKATMIDCYQLGRQIIMPYLNNDLVHTFYRLIGQASKSALRPACACVYGSHLTFDTYCIDAQTDSQNREGRPGYHSNKVAPTAK